MFGFTYKQLAVIVAIAFIIKKYGDKIPLIG